MGVRLVRIFESYEERFGGEMEKCDLFAVGYIPDSRRETQF